jgi:hypothetical protein
MPKSNSQNFNEELATIEMSKFQREVQNSESLSFVVASEKLKNSLHEALLRDEIVADLKTFILNGWPDKSSDLPAHLCDFYNYRDELIVEDNLLYKGQRLYVPVDCRAEVMNRIHSSHIGLQGCLPRAREAVFWPNMNKNIEKTVSVCSVCAKIQREQAKEPLMSHEVADRPWQRVACDLFTYNNIDYLLTVDYYSNFF